MSSEYPHTLIDGDITITSKRDAEQVDMTKVKEVAEAVRQNLEAHHLVQKLIAAAIDTAKKDRSFMEIAEKVRQRLEKLPLSGPGEYATRHYQVQQWGGDVARRDRGIDQACDQLGIRVKASFNLYARLAHEAAELTGRVVE